MKILYIDFITGLGGSQISLYLIAKYLKDTNKNNFVIVLPGKGEFYNKLKKDNINVEILNAINWRLWVKDWKGYVLGIISFLPRFLINLFRWIRYYREFRPDIIHININRLIEPLISAKILNIPVVIHFRDILDTMDYKFIFGEKLFFQIINFADSVIANSSTCKDHIAPFIKKPIFTIVNAIDIECYNKTSINKNDSLRKNSKIKIINVGGIQRLKNQKDFVEIAVKLLKEIKNIEFYIVGAVIDNNYYNLIKNLISKSGYSDHFILTGHIDDMASMLSKMDILVHNNVIESFGRVYIEAMGAGVPVVTYSSGPARDILSNGEAGILVAENNQEEMVFELTELINSNLKRKNLGEFGRKKVNQEYGIELQLRKIIEVYNLIINKN
ncbi:MAG: hypothetical protein CMI96_01200 [Pelagibacteraceae bacterium]|nr:hypothetical protein [Pelagibacteraceae bacterium]|tara:strand:+ start:39216 stop:40373 length:1158 start_codon:yes stop_codon:yes gene_type:complete